MPFLQPSRVPRQLLAPALLAALACPGYAQLFRGPVPQQPVSALPATQPTSLPAANALPAPLAATPDGPTGPPHRALVTFSHGNLNVQANNSSLHQILRSIARQTGMKISGGVADQRVFGDYGPADPSAVLATLLDGTGVNMLLKQDEARTPVQLTLTPRSGEGPSAPATDIADTADDTMPPPAQPQSAQPVLTGTAPLPRQPDGPVSIPQPDNNINGSPSNTSPTASTFPTTNSVPIDSIPTPSTTPSTTGIVDAPNPPPPGSTTSPSPNGVATPDQIYQQLLKMQQQRQQQQQGTTPAPTPPSQ
jgi:hypothetical protein